MFLKGLLQLHLAGFIRSFCEFYYIYIYISYATSQYMLIDTSEDNSLEVGKAYTKHMRMNPQKLKTIKANFIHFVFCDSFLAVSKQLISGT